jgi:tripartite-type tricarboxylate transporter receptor subunit TctC
MKKYLIQLLLASFAFYSSLTFAQSNQYTIFVPFSAGGTVDIVARIIGQFLTQETGVPAVVDNRLGAGGNIAVGVAVKAKPNGYNLLAHHQGIAIGVSLVEGNAFHIEKDLVPIATVGFTPNVLVVNKNSPFKNLKEFIQFASKNPLKLNYGSAGIGSNGHLAMELFSNAAGISLTHVPYKGMPQAVADVVAGQVDVVLTTMPAALPFIQSGRVRALATSGAKRSSTLPEIPTFIEQGVANFTYEPWYGFLAPASTPAIEIDKLSKIILKATKDPEVSKRLSREGIELVPMGKEQFSTQFSQDNVTWPAILKKLNIKNN